MVMTEVFDNLRKLQGILAEKYRLETKIDDSPKQLTSRNELLDRLKKEFIEKTAVYEEVRGKVEHLKAELAEAEASRESGEKGMDNITTHREYEALDKQISEATERENAVRKDLQKEEKKLAELSEQLRTDEAMMASQKDDLDKDMADLEEKVSKDKARLEELSQEEKDIIPNLDQEIVYKFQRIIKRNADGIVAVKNGVCTGCHMLLPAQFANEVQDGDKILFCPYCSRILFYQQADEGEVADYLLPDESDSMSDFESEFADEFDDEMEDSDLADDTDGDSDNDSSVEF